MEKLNKFLELAKKYGYTRIAFSSYDAKNKASKEWGITLSLTGLPCNKHMVFGHPNARDESGWSAIWKICRQLNIDSGCGNSSQHQIDIGFSNKVGARIFFLEEGEWKEVPKKYNTKEWRSIFINYLQDDVYDDYDVICCAKKLGVIDVLLCPIEDVPLYISDKNPKKVAVASLRLKEIGNTNV